MSDQGPDQERAVVTRRTRPTTPRSRTVARARAGTAASTDDADAKAAVDKGKEKASTAADKGKEKASTAADKGKEVASTAADKGKEVASTAIEKARDLVAQSRTLVDETKSQIQGQVDAQTERLAGTLRRFGNEAAALADGRAEESETLRDYLRQAADRFSELADDVERRGFEGLVDDVQTFARRRPAAFVAAAAVAGVGVGRLVRASGGEGGGRPQATPPARRPRAGAGSR